MSIIQKCGTTCGAMLRDFSALRLGTASTRASRLVVDRDVCWALHFYLLFTYQDRGASFAHWCWTTPCSILMTTGHCISPKSCRPSVSWVTKSSVLYKTRLWLTCCADDSGVQTWVMV